MENTYPGISAVIPIQEGPCSFFVDYSLFMIKVELEERLEREFNLRFENTKLELRQLWEKNHKVRNSRVFN